MAQGKEQMIDRFHALNARLQRASEVSYLPLLKTAQENYESLHRKLDEILLKRLEKHLGKAKLADDAEEQKEAASLPAIFQKFIRQAGSIREEVTGLGEDLGADQNIQKLDEGLVKVDAKLQALDKDFGRLSGPFGEEVDAIKWKLRDEEKDPEEEGKEAASSPDEKLLQGMEEQPWKREICSELIAMKTQLHGLLAEHGLDFETEFSKVRQRVILAVEEAKYTSLKGLRKPKQFAELEAAKIAVVEQLEKITAREGELQPKDFKIVALPVGRVQEQVEVAVQRAEKKPLHYEIRQAESDILRKKVDGLFGELMRVQLVLAGGGGEAPFLFHPQRNSNNLYVYNILEKKVNRVTTSFQFPANAEMGMAHVGAEFYVAGGYSGNYHDYFHKFDTEGETTKLTNMPKTKSWFPLVHSASRDCLFTVGGYSNGGNMNETTQYLITGEKWQTLPNLQFSTYGSAAIYFEPDLLYNFGGYSSQASLCVLDFSAEAPAWKNLEVAGHNWKGWYYRDAVIINNETVIFFGQNNNSCTLILERDGETFKVASQKSCINYAHQKDQDAACRVFDGQLYAFPTNQFTEVQRFDLESWAKDSL